MTYCANTHVIDICKSCKRHISNIETPTKQIYEMTIYNPRLMPKASCEGLIEKEK